MTGRHVTQAPLHSGCVVSGRSSRKCSILDVPGGKKQGGPMARRRIVNRLVYETRDRTLRRMGFPSYKAYLESPLWAVIRRRILDAAGSRCVLCNGKATQVHHRSYHRKALAGKKPQLLLAVCGDCHRNAEYDHAGIKRTTFEASQILAARLDRKKRDERREQIRRRRRDRAASLRATAVNTGVCDWSRGGQPDQFLTGASGET